MGSEKEKKEQYRLLKDKLYKLDIKVKHIDKKIQKLHDKRCKARQEWVLTKKELAKYGSN